MSSKVRVVIYGAGGYGGVGLVENLLNHPGVEISALVSREGAGEAYFKLYPHLRGMMDQEIEHAETFEPEGRGDFVFFSTPDGVGQKIASRYLKCGYRIIDFSGDFRFNNPKTYEDYSAWQQGKTEHACPELLNDCVYGSPEWNREALKMAQVVGNPGCMAISCLLALYPVSQPSLIDTDSIVLDVKTGISGAGKKPKALFHFPAADGNSYAYKVGKHQHLFEIEKHLSLWTEKEVVVSFTPHVIPAVRGILSTCYCKLDKNVEFSQVNEAFTKAYAQSPFVHYQGEALNELIHARGSNQCRLSVNYVERNHSIVITSVIDNLQKGQSGNAVQVMNIMLGLEETHGLTQYSRYP
ncbi:MAG: N-acetyl-gamma-glutamyl-phosphate reductase [Planctomycetes bacterium]|nr:N-acetyl-gamma-glutamyl-phosphate reductase [Planctomycetota bacterium]